MSSKYKSTDRIKSVRLQIWNYGWIGSYFITICTKNREHYFGEIVVSDSENEKCRDAMHCVPLSNLNSTQNKFGPQRKNMVSIIRGFKSAVTKQARMINPEFAW